MDTQWVPTWNNCPNYQHLDSEHFLVSRLRTSMAPFFSIVLLILSISGYLIVSTLTRILSLFSILNGSRRNVRLLWRISRTMISFQTLRRKRSNKMLKCGSKAINAISLTLMKIQEILSLSILNDLSRPLLYFIFFKAFINIKYYYSTKIKLQKNELRIKINIIN